MIFRIVRTDVAITLRKAVREPENTFMAAEKLAKVMNERRRQIAKIVAATKGPNPLSESDINSFNFARFLADRASRFSSASTLFGGFLSSILISWSCKQSFLLFVINS